MFWSAKPNPDWGFDEIWPSTKSWEQPWFKNWVDQYQYEKSPFAYAMGKEVDALAEDMRKAIERQVYIPIKKDLSN